LIRTYADDWNQSRLQRWLLAYYYFILFDQPEKGAKARKENSAKLQETLMVVETL
jgi:hypothetical protein